jgi:large repetitive protein
VGATEASCTANDDKVVAGTTVNLVATGTSGTSPYTYTWNNSLGSGNSKTPSVSATTTYTVTVTDANGMTATASKTITIITTPTTSITATESSCTTNDDKVISGATVNLSASGTGTFTWNNALGTGASKIATPSLSTTYIVTLTDANGCTVTASKSINVIVPPDITIANTTVSCSGSTTSAVVLTNVTGGLAPLSYEWTKDPSPTIISTQASPAFSTTGQYNGKVTDQNGCFDIASVTITVPDPISISHSVIHSQCNTGTGKININITGGTAPYTIIYKKSGTTLATHTINALPVVDFLDNLAAGTYDIEIDDANGCMPVITETITEPTPISIATNTTVNPTCFGSSNGSIDVTISGGTPTYTFNWKKDGVTYATTEDLTNLPAGSYVLEVIDNKGCTQTSSANVLTQPASLPNAPMAIANTNQAICQGTTLPALSVTVGVGETADWYDAASGGVLLASNTTSYTSTSAGTFYAQTRHSTLGCLSATRTSATLTINTPPPSVSATYITICNTSTTLLHLPSLLTGTGASATGTWTRISGTGGTFDGGAGTFTPSTGITTSIFRFTITGTSPCADSTTDLTITVQNCCPNNNCGTISISKNTGS